LGHELPKVVRNAELRRLQVRITLLEGNSTGDAAAPRGKQAQQATPGKMRLDSVRPMIPQIGFQQACGSPKAPPAQAGSDIDQIHGNSQLLDLLSDRPVAAQACDTVTHPWPGPQQFAQHCHQMRLCSSHLQFVDQMDEQRLMVAP
jgi:hypothetical protein